MPSQAHVFAHQALPILTFTNPAKVMAVLSGADGKRFLQDAWDNAAKGCQQSDCRSAEGLSYTINPTGTTGVVAVVTLPKPQEVGEAYFVGLFARFKTPENPRLDDLAWVRIFTLEHAIHPISEQFCAMLCEWDTEGVHRNHGEGSLVVEEDFIETVIEKIWSDLEKAKSNEQAKD